MSAKKGAGRPSTYDPDFAKIAGNVCRVHGSTDGQLAEIFGVTEQTINNWKKDHPEFFESLKDSKAEWDEKIEVALAKRATGYERTIERLDKFGDPIACKEELPPDPTSMIFWLKNRRPDRWRDKQDVEHSGKLESIVVNVIRKEPPKKGDGAG